MYNDIFFNFMQKTQFRQKCHLRWSCTDPTIHDTGIPQGSNQGPNFQSLRFYHGYIFFIDQEHLYNSVSKENEKAARTLLDVETTRWEAIPCFITRTLFIELWLFIVCFPWYQNTIMPVILNKKTLLHNFTPLMTEIFYLSYLIFIHPWSSHPGRIFFFRTWVERLFKNFEKSLFSLFMTV